jgi:hypothetical protein
MQTIGDLTFQLFAASISQASDVSFGISFYGNGPEESGQFAFDELLTYAAGLGLAADQTGVQLDIDSLTLNASPNLGADFLVGTAPSGIPYKMAMSDVLRSADLSEGTSTATTVDVDCSIGTNATLQPATTIRAGMMAAADKDKLDNVADNANAYAHPNHTGDVVSVGDGDQTIQPLAVVNSMIAANAVSTDKIIDANVTLAKLASDALTNLTVAEAPTNVAIQSSTGTDDTIAAVDGVNAGVMIPGDKSKLDGIADNANAYVHPDHTGEVTSTADGAQVIAAGVVTNTKLGAAAVTFDKIAAGSVDTSTLANDAVETAKIADTNVTLAKIVDITANSVLANTDVTPATVKMIAYNTLPTASRDALAYVFGWDASGNLAQFDAQITAISRKEGVDDLGLFSGSGATINFDTGSYDDKEFEVGNDLGLTLSASRDTTYELSIRQDVTGGRVVTAVTTVFSPPITIFPLDDTPGSLTVFRFRYDSINNVWHW